MATSTPFAIKAERVQQVVKAFLQEVPNQLYAYTIAEMGEDIGAPAFRETPKGQALSLRAPINTTDKLRFQTNTLGRALAPNEDGNISNITIKQGELSVEYGIDLSVVSYARIHEFGGSTGRGGAVKLRARPYLRPGFAEWTKKQIPRFLQRIAKAIES